MSEEDKLLYQEIDRLQAERNRYRMALEIISTETIAISAPSYCHQIAMRWRMVARKALKEVQGE